MDVLTTSEGGRVLSSTATKNAHKEKLTEAEILNMMSSYCRQHYYLPKPLQSSSVPIVIKGAADWFNGVYVELKGHACMEWLPVIQTHCRYSIQPFFTSPVTFQEGESACAAAGYAAALGSHKPVFPDMIVPDVDAQDGRALTVAADAATCDTVVSIPLLVNLYAVKGYGGIPAVSMWAEPTLQVIWTPGVAAAIAGGELHAQVRVYEHAILTRRQRVQHALAAWNLESVPRVEDGGVMFGSAVVRDRLFGYSR